VGLLAINYESGILAVVGMVLGLLWLGLLILIALPQTNKWLSEMQSWLKKLATILMAIFVFASLLELLVLGATSLGTTEGGILGANTPKFMASISHDLSPGDAVALQNQAVDNVLEGKNPYAHSNVVSAVISIDTPYDKTTPLRLGHFADDFPYPATADINAFWNEAVKTPDIIPVEFESKFGYPSGFFLIPAFFALFGVDSIYIVTLLLVIVSLSITIALTPSRMRFWLIGVCLGSLVIWNSIVSGMTGILYFPFLLLAWVLWRRNLWASAICMGIAVATKQIVWFFLPFYLILLFNFIPRKKAVLGLALVAVVFAVFNLPFIMAGPSLWFDSVISSMKDPLFPSGWGVVTLVLQGWINIESPLFFTILEASVFIAVITWYWRNARRYPYMGIILPVLPLFFAWRSLWPYFFFIDIILLVVVMQEYKQMKETSNSPLTVSTLR
jgi:uncharacterized membrane protein